MAPKIIVEAVLLVTALKANNHLAPWSRQVEGTQDAEWFFRSGLRGKEPLSETKIKSWMAFSICCALINLTWKFLIKGGQETRG